MAQIGIQGVHLKHFERVVMDVLPHVNITYSQLPPRRELSSPGRSHSKNKDETPPLTTTLSSTKDDWPFDRLPAFARVYGTALGQLANRERAQRKEDQIRNMLQCILALAPSSSSSENNTTTNTTTVVDFGGKTGHLAIPLALLRPDFTVIVVDLHEKSLELLHSKITTATATTPLQPESDGQSTTVNKSPTDLVNDNNRLRQCVGIPNLYTFSGPLQAFHGTFDIGVALHLCGEATDLALRKCGEAQARALVFAPCCVGKLNGTVKNPYIWQSTGTNQPTVQYPQSALFRQYINQQEDWNALARAADYGDALQSRTSRNAARRTAKALLETDRRLFLEQEFGYRTAMVRFQPWECTTKNDCILAWKEADTEETSPPLISLLPDKECHVDIQRTMDYLLCKPTAESDGGGEGGIQDKVDWTAEEEKTVRKTLEDFLHSDTKRLIFPVGMPARSRKLIHYVAEQMSLDHWGQGKRASEKTVVVERQLIKEEIVEVT